MFSLLHSPLGLLKILIHQAQPPLLYTAQWSCPWHCHVGAMHTALGMHCTGSICQYSVSELKNSHMCKASSIPTVKVSCSVCSVGVTCFKSFLTGAMWNRLVGFIVKCFMGNDLKCFHTVHKYSLLGLGTVSTAAWLEMPFVKQLQSLQ